MTSLSFKFPPNLKPCDNDESIMELVWKSAETQLNYHRFQHYTDHTIEHSKRIMRFASDLLEFCKIELNPDERFVLLSAIALHDVGMTTDSYLQDKDKDNDNKDLKLEAIRDMHHEFTYRYIKDNFRYFHLNEKQDFVDCIAKVARNHRKIDIKTETEIMQIGSSDIRFWLLSAIIRLADCLDYDFRRVHIKLLRDYQIEIKSKALWFCNYYVQSIRINHGKVEVGFRIPEAYKNTEEQKAITKYVVSDIKNQMRDLYDVFSSYDVNFHMDLVSPEITYDEILETMPDDVCNYVLTTLNSHTNFSSSDSSRNNSDSSELPMNNLPTRNISSVEREDVMNNEALEKNSALLARGKNMSKKKYFISYTTRSKKDVQWAKWTEWFFREILGGETIMQEYDFRPGDNFKMKMHEALQQSECVVCVLTHEYLNSTNCAEEWTNAEHIIPIKFDDCKPTGLLKSRSYINLCGLDKDAARKKLNEELSDKTRPTKEPVFPIFSKEPEYPVVPEFPMNNLPKRNKLFTGRADALMKIQEALENSYIVIVAGQGGFGKTQTAIEYVYSHAYDYHCIWCFNAESETRLMDDYRYFAEKIGLSAEFANDSRRVKEYIIDWFKSKKCLFIYDNAEGCHNLGEHIPQGHSSSHTLINSRERVHHITSSKKLDIKVFSSVDAIAFVKKRITNVSDSEAENLSNTLGRLPLALEQAVSYINNNDLTCAQYLSLFSDERNRMRLLCSHSTETEYEKTVATTWNITFDKLEKDAKSDQLSLAAVQLLKLCSYCAPDDIPLRMFIDGREQLPSHLREMLDPEDKLSHIDIIGKLENYSIISKRRENDEALLTIHRLVQTVLKDNLNEDTQWLSYCLDMATAVFHYQFGDKQSFDQFSTTLPHVLEIALHTDTTFRNDGNKQEKVAKLYHEAGFGLTKVGNSAKALEWFKKSLDISEKVLGTEHPSTATTYNNIASVYSRQGDYAKALEWYEKALSIREKVLGKEYPGTANTYNNIACVYNNQRDYAKALEWYEKALAIFENMLGKEHQDTAATYNNIALVYSRQGDYAKALEWYEKALAISEKVLGKEHPDTANTHNNIAGIYSRQGDYAKALELYEKALAIKEKVLGKEHPSTATTYNNIAVVYDSHGDYAKALELYEKALAIREKVLGKDHPKTVITRKNIANVYKKQGETRR